MHTDLLRALAEARHEDLLRERPTRRPRVRPAEAPPRFVRSRRRVGLVLIWAGARVIGDRQTALELAHE
jgi:hypothetical protein